MAIIQVPGGTLFVEDLTGANYDLKTLIADVADKDYSLSFRIQLIEVLSKLGKHAESALDILRILSKSRTDVHDGLIADAAHQAMLKIEGGKSSSVYNGNGILGNTFKPPEEKTVEKKELTGIEFEEEKSFSEEQTYSRCYTCGKLIYCSRSLKDRNKQLGTPKLCCFFCLRNDLYQKGITENYFLLSYRGIIGYYYYCYYFYPKNCPMPFCDICEIIDSQVKVSLQNPAFRYDQDSFTWFIDFNKVGKKKITFNQIMQTITSQLFCFNLFELANSVSMSKFFGKIKTELEKFSKSRNKSEKVYIPLFDDCGLITEGDQCVIAENLITFNGGQLIEKYQKKTSDYACC